VLVDPFKGLELSVAQHVSVPFYVDVPLLTIPEVEVLNGTLTTANPFSDACVVLRYFIEPLIAFHFFNASVNSADVPSLDKFPSFSGTIVVLKERASSVADVAIEVAVD
jgi:hypothetical protein